MRHDRVGGVVPTGTGASIGAAEAAIRQGDERAEAGDWPAAIEAWRAAGRQGAEAAARARLTATLRLATEGETKRERGLPRAALPPLALCLEAAVIGVLAFVAADRGGGGSDLLLLGLGWLGMIVSGAAALVFAARSGRVGGSLATIDGRGTLEELAARAVAVVPRLPPTGGSSSAPGAGSAR